MDNLVGFLSQIPKHQNWVLATVLVILFIWLIALSRRVRRTAFWMSRMLKGTDPVSLEKLLEENLIKLGQLDSRMQELEITCRQLERNLEKCVQGVGVVRFDAFQDVGGQQSFALALVDGNQDGVVMSSLYGRQDARCYAKPIRAGQATHHPSAEEQEALNQALDSLKGEAGGSE